MTDNFTGANKLLQSDVFLLDFLSFLKPQFLCQQHHLILHRTKNLTRISFQDFLCLLNVLLVVLVALFTFTRTSTTLDMIVETDLVFSTVNPLFCDWKTTGSWPVQGFDDVKHSIHRADVGIGSKVRTGFLVDGTSLEDARIELVGDADARISLAVLQKNVVFGIVLLDKRILQKQRVFFCVHYRIADVVYLAHKYLSLEPINFSVEIRRYPSFQVLRFTHIYNGMCVVVELIAARLFRQSADDAFQVCESPLVFFLRHLLCFTWNVASDCHQRSKFDVFEEIASV